MLVHGLLLQWMSASQTVVLYQMSTFTFRSTDLTDKKIRIGI